MISSRVTPFSKARFRWNGISLMRYIEIRLVIVTRLRSRGDKAVFSQTSPNSTLSVISARWGAMSPNDFRAFVGSSVMVLLLLCVFSTGAVAAVRQQGLADHEACAFAA